jgi:ABC-type iron transport system FetAB permease component
LDVWRAQLKRAHAWCVLKLPNEKNIMISTQCFILQKMLVMYIYISIFYIHVQFFLDVLPMVLSSGLTFVRLSKGYKCLDESVEI